MIFGMFKMQDGSHYECENEEQARQVWENAPKTEGTWVLVLGEKIVEEMEMEIYPDE